MLALLKGTKMKDIRIQQNWRIKIGTVEKLQIMKAVTNISINEIVNNALEAFLAKNQNMFPLKEDPAAEENTERNNTLKLFSDPEETKW